MKLVINNCYGGIGLSLISKIHLAHKKGIEVYPYKTSFFDFENGTQVYQKILKPEESESSSVRLLTQEQLQDKFVCEIDRRPDEWTFDIDNHRTDKDLISVIEEDGELANDRYSKLAIVEIPEGFDYKISDYDGVETVYVGKELRKING